MRHAETAVYLLGVLALASLAAAPLAGFVAGSRALCVVRAVEIHRHRWWVCRLQKALRVSLLDAPQVPTPPLDTL